MLDINKTNRAITPGCWERLEMPFGEIYYREVLMEVLLACKTRNPRTIADNASAIIIF